MQANALATPAASWKRVLGAMSVLLLVPVPLFGTYSLGTWSVSQPGGNTWSANGSSGFNLFITPQPGFAPPGFPVEIDFTAPVTFTSTSNNVNVTTQSFSAITNITRFPSNGPGGLTIAIGFLKSDGTLDSTIFQNTNQFTGTLPSSLSPTNNVTVGNTAKKALVRFVFNPIVTWNTVPSSEIHVTFSSGQ
jgi:hypothetical protein